MLNKIMCPTPKGGYRCCCHANVHAIGRIRLIIERDRWLGMHEMVAPSAAFGSTMRSIFCRETSGGQRSVASGKCNRPDFMGR